jgi:hypothetical protein
MSQATADIVVNAGDSIQFTFTPQAGGLTSLVAASLTVVSTGAYSALTVAGNSTSVAAPPGAPAADSILQLVLLLGPNTESGSLAYSEKGGASKNYFVNRPLFNPIIEIDLFGK